MDHNNLENTPSKNMEPHFDDEEFAEETLLDDENLVETEVQNLTFEEVATTDKRPRASTSPTPRTNSNPPPVESYGVVDDVTLEKKGLFGNIKLPGRRLTALPSDASPTRTSTYSAPPPTVAPLSNSNGVSLPASSPTPNPTSTTTTHSPAASTTTSGSDPASEYAACLAEAQNIDFSEEKKLNFLYKAGFDTLGRPVVVFVAANLPGKSLNPDRLLLYIIKEMDNVVARDYTLVYVHSYFSSQNRPAFAWLRKAYRILSRKYKKNLKSLFIIHPTFWIKTTFKLFKPFISAKFWQKLTYIEEINELYKFIHRDQIQLPGLVFQYGSDKSKVEPMFGIPLTDVMKRPDHSGHEVPVVVETAVKALMAKKANTIQGIFRLAGSVTQVQALRKEFDKGEIPNLEAVEDAHVIAGLLKLYFRELPEPLFPFEMYDKLVQTYAAQKEGFVPALTQLVVEELPPYNKALLRYLLELLSYIEKNSEVNKMNSSNLSIVFAPNLIRSPKESIQQAVMHAPIINSIMRAILDNQESFIKVLKSSHDKISETQ